MTKLQMLSELIFGEDDKLLERGGYDCEYKAAIDEIIEEIDKKIKYCEEVINESVMAIMNLASNNELTPNSFNAYQLAAYESKLAMYKNIFNMLKTIRELEVDDF